MPNATLIRPTHHKASVAYNSAHLQTLILESLVAYWRMEEVSWDGTANELIDISGGGNHGAMQEVGSVNSSTGKLGQGFNANGTNYFHCPVGVISQTAMTIAMWIKSNSSLLDTEGRFFATEDSGGNLKEMRTGNDGVDTPLSLFVINEDNTDNVAVVLPAALVNNKYEFVLWTLEYDAGSNTTTVTPYLNGVAGISDSMSGMITIPDVAFSIGAWSGAVVPSPSGIDEIAVWSRVLNINEIKQIYNSDLALAIV